MASYLPFKKIRLDENDVPFASLGLPPENCSVDVLRKHVQTRGFPTSGLNKADLVALAKEIAGKNLKIADDAGKGRILLAKARALRTIDLNAANVGVFPTTGFKVFPSTEIPHNFHFGSIYKYLVDSAVIVDSDGEADSMLDYGVKKPLARGRLYFRSGHVKELQDVLTRTQKYCVKGLVKSSMKDAEYTVMVVIDPSTGDVVDAECHCRGSALQRCSHVAAVLIAIEDYTSLFGYSPPACTSTRCSWNQGGKEKRADPVYATQYSNVRIPSRAINFDANVVTDPVKVNNDLMSLATNRSIFPKGSKWETSLDFMYENYLIDEDRKAVLAQLVNELSKNLAFGFHCPSEIPNTKDQSKSGTWHGLRRLYITASVVKKFLRVPKGDIMSLLRSHMWYPRTFSSKYTDWGSANEVNAKQSYERKTGSNVITTGMWINPKYPGLAASPDGIVFCHATESWGVVEFKCPFTLKDSVPTAFETVLTTQQKSAFCLRKDGENISVKRTHPYYFQMQMVMGIVGVKWCDFVVYTTKDVWYQRISFDEHFWQEISGELVKFHKTYMCVEYFEMRSVRRLPPALIDSE